MQVESAVLFEGVNNALKLLGDQYLARVYRLASQRFHLEEVGCQYSAQAAKPGKPLQQNLRRGGQLASGDAEVDCDPLDRRLHRLAVRFQRAMALTRDLGGRPWSRKRAKEKKDPTTS